MASTSSPTVTSPLLSTDLAFDNRLQTGTCHYPSPWQRLLQRTCFLWLLMQPPPTPPKKVKASVGTQTDSVDEESFADDESLRGGPTVCELKSDQKGWRVRITSKNQSLGFFFGTCCNSDTSGAWVRFPVGLVWVWSSSTTT